MSIVPNLQRLVYDVAVAATECNPTQAHSAREAVIKCCCMKTWRHHCVGSVLVISHWAPSRQGNSVVTAAAHLIRNHQQWQQRASRGGDHRWWIHVHIVGGEATRAALTLMRVSTPVCPRAAVGRLAVLGSLYSYEYNVIRKSA